MIICEGPDNSGKTTLANELAERFGLEYCKSRGPGTNYDWWMQILTDSPEALSEVVLDRFYFSELVYGIIVRGRIKLDPQQREVVESLLTTAQPLVVRCKLIRDEVLFNGRPQTFDWETTLKAEDYYDRILGHQSSFMVVPYRALVEGDLDQVLSAAKFYLDVMPQWVERRKLLSHGRGQMDRADLMIVGQQFARDNKWKVPFERSRSGRLIHDVLRQTLWPMKRLWITNAYKESNGLSTGNMGALTAEAVTIKPRFVLTLGNKATGLWSVVCGQNEECAAIPTMKLFHPGYWLRKGSREEALDYYIEALNAIRGDVDQEIHLERSDR